MNAPRVLFYIAVFHLRKEKLAPNRINILTLNRAIFAEDVNVLSNLTNYNFIRLNKLFFTEILKHYSPDALLSHKEFYEIVSKLPRSDYSQYQSFVQKFLFLLIERYNINCVLTANFNYSWQQEVFSAAKSYGVKRVVLFKEGINPVMTKDATESAHSKLLSFYKNSFLNVDLILVYNKRMKAAFEENFDLSAFDIAVEVIGIPRLAFLHEETASPNSGIVFFSFDIQEKFRHLGLSPKILQDLETEVNFFCDAFTDFVIKHPNIPVTIKTKSNQKFLDVAKSRFEKLLKVSNVRFTNEGSSLELLANNRVVIGFNSTTLVEALIANRRVISFRLQDSVVQCMFSGSDFYDEICIVPEKLADALKKSISNRKVDKRNVTDKWLEDRVGYLGFEVLRRFDRAMLEILQAR